MIPKGLLIAITVGIFSALALGVYLEKTYNNQALQFVNGPSISIISEKNNYELAEQIKIEVINTGTTDVLFLSSEPSLRVRALDGTEFYSMFSDGTKLAPKEKLTITWSQEKNDGSPVLEGRYVLESFAFDGNAKIHDSITVNILK